MIELTDFNIEENKYNFPDIYFKPEYHKIWEENTNDGIAKIIIYKNKNLGKIYYPFMMRPCSVFEGSEEYKNIYEAISNYGYGGPILENVKKEDLNKIMNAFRYEVEKAFDKANIITELIRFHPLIKNYSLIEENNLVELIRDKSTIYVDLRNKDDILNNMATSTRNQVRQSLDNNLTIDFVKDPTNEEIKNFYEIYIENMKAVNASEYYMFNLEFFNDTFKYLKNHVELAFVYHEKELISATIFMFYNEFVHYHLSGAKRKALDLRVNNFLLFRAAKRYSKLGFKFFHLGGGIKDDDGLFNFKKGFAPDNIEDFYIGRKIHNKELYKEIYDKRRRYMDIPEKFVLPHS